MNTAASNASNLAFVFPGQGSQSLGMVSPLLADFPQLKQRFDEASQALGFDLLKLVSDGPEADLNRTENTQPALLVASVVAYDAWCNAGGPQPALMAGHSFGEYSALVCAGALDFAAAVLIARDRGRYMQAASPEGAGAMAAILGLELSDVNVACAAAGGVCSPANLNAPGQIVIAGEKSAVVEACEKARELGARKALELPVSVPAHCALMAPAAEQLKARLEEVVIKPPQIPVIHNLDLNSYTEDQAIKNALIGQLCSPVRWIETIELCAGRGIKQLIECGPGKVLSALIKRIDRQLNTAVIPNHEAITAAQEKITGMSQ